MNRPTIADLAEAAGVSVSTVNRILSGAGSVRQGTIQRVRDAADEIGFYGLSAIESRKKQAMPHFRLGFLLQQSSREVYRHIAQKIEEAAERRRDEVIDTVIEFVDDLAPDNIANRLTTLGQTCDAVAVIAADHPLIGQAIQDLKAQGIPVIGYVTDQSSPDRAGHVGTDNWKLGRTAAWFIAQTTHQPGRVAVFIGNHRYQSQDISDASFRSYMREHAGHLTIDATQPTQEEPDVAYRMVSDLMVNTDDLVGIFINGGGISGVLRALREAPEQKRRNVRLVSKDIGPETRKGLAEGLITAALCHPLDETSDQLIQTMIDAISQQGNSIILQRIIPFEIITPESL